MFSVLRTWIGCVQVNIGRDVVCFYTKKHCCWLLWNLYVMYKRSKSNMNKYTYKHLYSSYLSMLLHVIDWLSGLRKMSKKPVVMRTTSNIVFSSTDISLDIYSWLRHYVCLYLIIRICCLYTHIPDAKTE